MTRNQCRRLHFLKPSITQPTQAGGWRSGLLSGRAGDDRIHPGEGWGQGGRAPAAGVVCGVWSGSRGRHEDWAVGEAEEELGDEGGEVDGFHRLARVAPEGVAWGMHM
jgi:hypothetical protein